MTATAANSESPEAAVPVETVTATIDGISVTVPKGTLIIRAAELIGIEIPRFCDHPLLEPVAMCRMCLVEVAPGPPKPQPACAIALNDGMEVKTQRSSVMADKAQLGVMEFILANHPLDCPICDKGGECPLQNQAMSNGRDESRFTLPKATFPKPINVSSQILLDRERCVNCARCTRFADQIAGDPFITLLERGGKQQVGINPGHPFDSYFSGNTVQICPVGALTSAKYRFRARPFDLVSVPTVCEHCASGCALRTDYRRSTVTRRLAGDDPAVNEEWNCDKGRFGFVYAQQPRLETPMIREDGELRAASWPEAIQRAAQGLVAAGGRTGVLAGGRLTVEDAMAYAGFARAVLGSDHVDFRARTASQEEAVFLAGGIAGSGLGVTYQQLEAAPAVLLVAFEPEDESPIVFLRMRKAVRKGSQRVVSIAPLVSFGAQKLAAQTVLAAPGDEVDALGDPRVREVLDTPGAVVLVGERAAAVPGLLASVAALVEGSGAELAWVPRRAGERGALEAGLLPGLLPGGLRLSDADSRSAVAAAFDVPDSVLPDVPGLDGAAMLATIIEDGEAAAQSAAQPDAEAPEATVAAMMVAGVDLDDLPDPAAARRALGEVGFVVSLEQRLTTVAEFADVVLPVADVTGKAGTYLNWEGRARGFGRVFNDTSALGDARVLALLADEMSVLSDGPVSALHGGDPTRLRQALADLAALRTPGSPPEPVDADASAPSGEGVRLATWRQLVDAGTLQQGEPYLAAGARPSVAKISAPTAARHGLEDGHVVTITTESGSARLAVEIADVADDTVWVPANSQGIRVATDLGAGWGDTVQLSAGGGA